MGWGVLGSALGEFWGLYIAQRRCVQRVNVPAGDSSAEKARTCRTDPSSNWKKKLPLEVQNLHDSFFSLRSFMMRCKTCLISSSLSHLSPLFCIQARADGRPFVFIQMSCKCNPMMEIYTQSSRNTGSNLTEWLEFNTHTRSNSVLPLIRSTSP